MVSVKKDGRSFERPGVEVESPCKDKQVLTIPSLGRWPVVVKSVFGYTGIGGTSMDDLGIGALCAWIYLSSPDIMFMSSCRSPRARLHL